MRLRLSSIIWIPCASFHHELKTDVADNLWNSRWTPAKWWLPSCPALRCRWLPCGDYHVVLMMMVLMVMVVVIVMILVMVMIVMVMMLNVIGDDFTFHPPEQGWSSIWSDKCSTRPFLHCGNGELFTFTFQIIFHLCSFWQKSNIHFHCLSYFIIACCNSQY